MINQSDLISQIACEIRTYRVGELDYRLDESHVDHWISQFDADVRGIILQETNSLLSRCYFSPGKVKQFLYDLVECSDLWGNDEIVDEIEQTQFLKIQHKGSSQAHLLELLDDLLIENYIVGLSTTSTDKTTRYIYLDDCLFSGNTLKRDLERWIDSAKEDSTLDIIFLATYSSGEYYIRHTVLPKLCDPKGIRYRLWSLKRFNNNSRDWYNYDCLWPKETHDPNIDAFIEILNQQSEDNGWPIRLFREKDYVSPLFTDNRSREVFEKAMLQAGSYIYSCCANPNHSMKPLGYEFFNSLGFGAFFATYKNISNNCPLAFWWGDPCADDNHPFSKWYPLLPRKVNNNDVFIWE